MPDNKSMILMHLMDYLKETNQWGSVSWKDVLSYCLGYYGEITEDHLWAVMCLERYNACPGHYT